MPDTNMLGLVLLVLAAFAGMVWLVSLIKHVTRRGLSSKVAEIEQLGQSVWKIARKHRRGLLICLCLFLGIGCYLVFHTPRILISQDLLADLGSTEIKTEQDVISVMGAPPGDYSVFGRSKWRLDYDRGTSDSSHFKREWYSDDGYVIVWFDGHGQISTFEVNGPEKPPSDIFGRVMWQLGIGKKYSDTVCIHPNVVIH